MFLPSSNLLLLPLRIGRTARAGAEGQAVTFIEDADRRLLKEIVKKTGVQMQQREVPAAAVQQWQGKVEGSHGDVWRVLKEEREEKEMRQVGGPATIFLHRMSVANMQQCWVPPRMSSPLGLHVRPVPWAVLGSCVPDGLCIVHLQAEMEASKMHNVLEYEDEIKARPARTWFQSERQKTDVKKRSAEAAADGEDGEEQVGACRGHGDAPSAGTMLQLRCSNNLLISTCLYQLLSCALSRLLNGMCLGALQGGKGKGSKEERKARKKAEHTKKTREEESGPRGKNKLAQETEMFTKVRKLQHRNPQHRYPACQGDDSGCGGLSV